MLRFYYLSIHSDNGQLKRLHQQLKMHHVNARTGAHKIADIMRLNPLALQQQAQLKHLRFAKQEPKTDQVMLFIQQILR